MIRKVTPVLIVEEIEPVLPYWVDRLGFEKTVEVPEGDKLGFVILARDGVEVMYQSRESVKKDEPGVLESAGSPFSALFIEVTDFDGVARALEGADVIVPKRTTFYGATEIITRDPAGNVITFAQMASA
jgi:uncharacterized glyoxalase superfamily protein PhnB